MPPRTLLSSELNGEAQPIARATSSPYEGQIVGIEHIMAGHFGCIGRNGEQPGSSMNILVCVKRVPLTGGKIVLTEDQRAISTRHLGFTVSPHEECGAEEGVRLIEQHGGSSTVLT